MALRALIYERRSELSAAMNCAQEALILLSARDWGVLVGLPLSVLLTALTAAGRYEDAEKWLDTPPPEALFHTLLSLPYHQARGRLYLATSRPRAALVEFQACGGLMAFWGLDVSCLVTWQADTALAMLALGEGDAARQLLEDHLKGRKPGLPRARGASLRALAAVSDSE